MESDQSPIDSMESDSGQLPILRSHQTHVEESAGGSEATASNSLGQRCQPGPHRTTRTHLGLSTTNVTNSTPTTSPSSTETFIEEPAARAFNTATLAASPPRGRLSGARLIHTGRDSAVGSPSHEFRSPDRGSLGVVGAPEAELWELENSLIEHDSLRNGIPKRGKARFNNGHKTERDLLRVLKKHGAQTALLYRTTETDLESNDIWPNFRSKAKRPAHYTILDLGWNEATSNLSSRLSQTAVQTRYTLKNTEDVPEAQGTSLRNTQSTAPSGKGRPLWNLPVELVELVITYLNRDDIKSLRLVSHELNNFTSQAAFKTVVVPFNTEIYGMLGQESTVDRKGKKRAKITRPEYLWKNANGDEVYNGHGLDVFRGFGRHIVRFGMSFEVNEESLCSPPLKSITEHKTSFWGSYDWPYEEYRRFDAVAGLESAADETPRMKIAFSELSKVSELALSVDSGLGWLNGPDRSIRARVLQTAPCIFGSRQIIPDRRTGAQRELWNHIESMYNRTGEDVRLASLCRLDGARSLLAAEERSLLAAAQPELPFIDSRLLHEAFPYDCDLPKDPEGHDMLGRRPSDVPLTDTGVLFTSCMMHHNDAEHDIHPITPATLSKAQREWLLETEWAQRAFMSSYMLSIIDNRITFESIHTLNISSLSDRYISMLNRTDFWDALPRLKTITLIVIPGWRTVEKDEAGFVDTPRVDPTDQVDTFYALLRAQIAPRAKIVNLTIGYSASGEHAEGLHARNKLLMPAPVLPLRATLMSNSTLPPIETATLQDAETLRQFLVCFPHLEEFRLRNCWITPPSLLQFVQLHDGHKLKHLALDSVSLTALLRPHGNAQVANAGQPMGAAQNPGAAHNLAIFGNANNNMAAANIPAGHHIPANGQPLSNYIQTLIAQLQQIQANAGNNQPHHQVHALQAQLQQQLQNAQALTVQQPQGNGSHVIQQPMQQNHQAQHLQLSFAQVAQLGQLANQVNILQQVVGQNVPAPAGAAAHGLNVFAAPFVPAVHPPPPPVPPAPANAATEDDNPSLQAAPRPGSWMDIIDQVSPGTNLSDFDSKHSKARLDRMTALDSISFVSCGYAKLVHLGLNIDQTGIQSRQGTAGPACHALFGKRHTALSPIMMSSKSQFLGEIVQDVSPAELAALDAGWNLRTGWDDAEAARAAEFDGLLKGGTGRFTGKVQRSDRVEIGSRSCA
ncbi:hypothetical protein E8E13_006480 [Curvularia kusanoi]|uniref:F-box domain-containing protein n=1 Tax=Curvularia kusanoi TaxID=90978 RepID=A0A9P4T998_CURKU|nr:hypothetical protein E8E13_006480 [Curvularia kusanoi]